MNDKASSLQMTEQPAQTKKISIANVQDSLGSLFSKAMSENPLSFINLANQYNPFLQNQRLKMLNSYPAVYSPETIAEFLQAPQNHEGELRSASAALSASQYLYYLILREAADIPLFKHTVIPPALTKEEYESKDFKEEEAFVNEWLNSFDVINTGKRVQLETKRDGKSTYLFRQSLITKGDKKEVCYVAWQKMPLPWIKLTAIGQHGYIASFNFLIFMQPQFSVDQYPDYIKEIWQQMTEGGAVYRTENKDYAIDYNKLSQLKIRSNYGNFTSQGVIEKIGKTAYMYWVQLPQDLCFTLASDTSNAWAVPDTIGLFPALQELTDYSTLAGLIASTPLTAVLTGQAEACPGAQPGQDQCVLSPSTMLAFQNTFNSMASSNIQAFLAPFKDLKLQSLPNIPNSSDIKTKATQNFISTAGEGGLIVATDKPSVAMIKGAQKMAASRYDFVTRQIEAILNDNLKKHCKLKYNWTVQLWGDIYSFDDTVRSLKELVQSGASFLLPRLASAYDLTIPQLRGINNYLEANKVYDLLKPLQWATMQQNIKSTGSLTSENKSPGRPSIEDSDVENDNTAASKEAGTNTADMRQYIENGVCLLCGSSIEEGHVFCEECEEEMGLEDR